MGGSDLICSWPPSSGARLVPVRLDGSRLVVERRHSQAAAERVLDLGGPGMAAHRSGHEGEGVAASDAGPA